MREIFRSGHEMVIGIEDIWGTTLGLLPVPPALPPPRFPSAPPSFTHIRSNHSHPPASTPSTNLLTPSGFFPFHMDMPTIFSELHVFTILYSSVSLSQLFANVAFLTNTAVSHTTSSMVILLLSALMLIVLCTLCLLLRKMLSVIPTAPVAGAQAW